MGGRDGDGRSRRRPGSPGGIPREPGRRIMARSPVQYRQPDRETREFLVDVTVKELPTVWAAGQRAEVFISVGKKDQALLVPARMIVWQQNQPGVFIYTGGRASWTEITLGPHGQDSVEAVNGISRGDVVPSSQIERSTPYGRSTRVTG